MTKRISDLQDRISLLEAELNKTRDELDRAQKQDPIYLLAEQLHDRLCKFNHTDGCSWFYEVKGGEPNWTGWAHGKYLAHAQRVTGFCEAHEITVEQALDIHNVVNTLA